MDVDGADFWYEQALTLKLKIYKSIGSKAPKKRQ
jgi:hypothetical protein